MTTEDHWTQPSDWCPNPKWWHADTTDATEHEVTNLVAAFVSALQPDLVVETGSNTGQTSQAIGRALRINSHGVLDTIESDADLHQAAIAMCVGLPVNCIHGSSLDYIPAGQIGFAWFDSDVHIRHLEVERFLPHFATGAIFGVHDTGPQHPVKNYLQPLVDQGRIIPITLRTPRGVTFAQVL